MHALDLQRKGSTENVCKKQNSKNTRITTKILYTPGKENPADLTTKPKPTHAYINNKLWINGPDYLEEPNEIWEEKHTLKEIIKNNLTQYEKTSIHNEIKRTTIKMNYLHITPQKEEGILNII